MKSDGVAAVVCTSLETDCGKGAECDLGILQAVWPVTQRVRFS